MPNYILNRTHTLRTTNGVVSFVKGEPTWVIPPLELDAVAIGAVCADGEGPDLLADEVAAKPVLGGDERKSAVFAAFDLLIERNESRDFTGSGVPTIKAVEKIVDFDLDKGEVLAFWQEHKLAKTDA